MANGLIINGRFLNRKITGVERYAHEITRRLPVNAWLECPPWHLTGWNAHLWEQIILPNKARDDVLWSPANTGPVYADRHVVTVHDAFPMDHPEWYRPGFAAWYQVLLPRLAHRAVMLMTVSKYSQDRLIRIFGLPVEKVIVAPGGVDRSRFFPLPEAEKSRFRSSIGLPEAYVLFLGSAEPRKNLESLVTAWEMIRPKFPEVALVLVGNGTRTAFNPRELARRQVLLLGYLDESCLPGLYAASTAFVLPSLDEGFGLTVLEAMSCGTPVVTSKVGALPEIAGEAALYVDPKQPEDIARGLERILRMPDLRQDQVQKGFLQSDKYTWEKTTKIVNDVMSQVAG